MGSTNVYSDEEINVLITGFGPFKKEYPLNPSWEIASRLPAILPPLRAKQPSTQKPPLIPRVNLHVHPDPIRVSYKTVRALIPKLWAPTFDSSSSTSTSSTSTAALAAEPTTSEAPFSEQDAAATTTTTTTANEEEPTPKKYDFAIHIGMAGPQPRWAIERLAHRDGYALRDVDGEFLRDKENQLKDDDWVWKGCPAELRTDLDLDVILEKWRGYAPPGLVVAGTPQNGGGGDEKEDEKEGGKEGGKGGKEGEGGKGGGGGAKWYGNDIKGGNKGEKLVISEDPGRYLCDFIYYSSLAELYKRKAERKVVFLHVPCEVGKDGEYVRIGQELMLGLVRGVAEWLVDEKKRKGDLR
ncbi:peptidase C15, pyroglutamyl peptidase I-like protein [Neurospora crassa]|uniref:Peptidase C15, pyroglutamyl peptidase I-like protein n=1 Tax=Neurospora crassa (strain ATCC 24698 / 74-OR23-1A / CBS 708.71 / DSM 1257 / FGSC 987) TaxID=367110 RepID=Q7SF02_NEUCR|nr:hypothetical protein NCU07453 [Neurospora crassa OR74A]EAA35404.1 hypothetical protein NCU07453 [Neurospora crassa OR74A]KHE80734.1 peptidase C15, pyroglutamyl peptidase I-like protein [Neurospora crassa]|eukprot:XP_964640.1 hypothetical protein NCU07453 [Neurospora crassa OR74A]